jgi:hypothetical protein
VTDGGSRALRVLRFTASRSGCPVIFTFAATWQLRARARAAGGIAARLQPQFLFIGLLTIPPR